MAHAILAAPQSPEGSHSLERRGKNHLPPARAGIAQNIT